MRPATGAEELRAIAAELRELLETSPRTKNTVTTWTETAYATYRRLLDAYPDVRLPIQVMHFVHDADVRARDPEYRENQEDVMRDIIDELERGTLPRSRGLTISFTTRGFIAFVIAFIVVMAIAIFRLVR